MSINLTLIGQSIAFFFFVWFCMKFVWPPLMKTLDERKKNIADGIAAGEKGRHELELAEKRAVEVIREAKEKASEIVQHAERRAAEIADEAKGHAKEEAERILSAARADAEQEINHAREALRAQLGSLVVAGASRILEREIDAKAHAAIVDSVVKEL